jgi:carbon-monoxide dehydrogenase medium subunit
MIPQVFEYTAPKTLDEALGLLATGAKPLAGGQSLIPMMKLRLATPERLVDLGRLRDLNYIREQGGNIHIGATTTHYEVESSSVLRVKCPLLPATAACIGDVQVRNMGTIGGSVAHADPAADYPAALQALEARIVLKGAKSERTVAAADFFIDTFTTALEPGDRGARRRIRCELSEIVSARQRFCGGWNRGAHREIRRQDQPGANRGHRLVELFLSRHSGREGARRQNRIGGRH